jgi:hypothetical protein
MRLPLIHADLLDRRRCLAGYGRDGPGRPGPGLRPRPGRGKAADTRTRSAAASAHLAGNAASRGSRSGQQRRKCGLNAGVTPQQPGNRAGCRTPHTTHLGARAATAARTSASVMAMPNCGATRHSNCRAPNCGPTRHFSCRSARADRTRSALPFRLVPRLAYPRIALDREERGPRGKYDRRTVSAHAQTARSRDQGVPQVALRGRSVRLCPLWLWCWVGVAAGGLGVGEQAGFWFGQYAAGDEAFEFGA